MTTPAYSLRSPDGSETQVDPDRYVALACDPARVVVVRACAGAGKTWLLVSRIARSLLDGVAPQDILAITFTRKAAGEMQQRLLELLQRWSALDAEALAAELRMRGIEAPTATQLERARSLYPELLAGGALPTLSTFHGWFLELLQAAPRRFGLPPHFTLIDNDDALLEQAWIAWLKQIAQDAQLRDAYRELVAAHGRSGAAKLIRLVHARRAEFRLAAAHGGLASGMDEAVPQSWRAWLSGWRAQLVLWCELWAQAGGVNARKAQQRALTALEALEADDEEALADALQHLLLTDQGQPRAPNPVMTQAVLDVIAQRGDTLDCRHDWSQRAGECFALAAAHDALRIEHTQALVLRLGAALILQYEALKTAQSGLDFSDLESHASQLLNDPELAAQVQMRLDRRYRQLLVDEFQDTNPVQWQALRAWLDAYSGDAQRPGVFIVGDDKQSIYRFRRADPQVFAAATDFLQQGFGAVVLSAQHTRRLSRAVLDWVNRVFVHAPEMAFVPHTGASGVGGQVGLLGPLSAPASAAAPTPSAGMRQTLEQADIDAEIGDVERDAARVARWIAHLLQQPLEQTDGERRLPRPRDVLLLLRKRRDRMPIYWRALLAAGVPARSGDPESNLLDTLEARDLLALLEFLVSPGSDLELAQVLKSPIVGLDDGGLLQLARTVREHRCSWWQALRLQLELDAEQTSPLADFVGRVKLWRGLLGVLPVHDLLDRVFAEQSVRQRYAAVLPRAVVPQALANLDAFLHLCLDLRGGRLLTPYALVRELRRGLARAPIPELEAVDAVRLSTIHGAKGLEAEIVVLADCDARPQSSGPVALLDWDPQQPHPRHFSLQLSSARLHPAQRPIQQQDKRMADREDWNLLYVAMTRARQQLWVSMLPGRGAGQGWSRLLQPDGVELATVAEVDLGAAPIAAAETVDPGLDLGWQGEPPLAPEPDSRASRIGQAMHRLLEVATFGCQPQAPQLPLRLALQYGLDDDGVRAAEAAAQRILASPQARRFFDPAQLLWARNEVEIGWNLPSGSGWGRIDRLLELDDAVWVLDYKLAAQGVDAGRYAAVLAMYAAAAASLRPGKPVRVALLGGDGSLHAWNGSGVTAIDGEG